MPDNIFNIIIFLSQKEQLPVDSDSDSEKPDENPVVVVVKPGDLTPEEVAEINAKKKFGKNFYFHFLC